MQHLAIGVELPLLVSFVTLTVTVRISIQVKYWGKIRLSPKKGSTLMGVLAWISDRHLEVG